jgi:hypothetical protein
MRIHPWAAACAALLAGAGCVVGSSDMQPIAATVKAEPPRQVKGQVLSADDVKVELWTADKGVVQLYVVKETTVTVDGRHIAAGQLPEGLDVRASYSVVQGGHWAALNIEALVGPPPSGSGGDSAHGPPAGTGHDQPGGPPPSDAEAPPH